MDGHRGVVHGGGERKIAIGETTPLGQERRSALEVEPLGADVLPLARTGGDHDRIADAFGVLLDHDRIGAGRQDAAREDPRGLAGTNRSLERMPGRHFADELEIDRYLRQRPPRARRSRP